MINDPDVIYKRRRDYPQYPTGYGYNEPWPWVELSDVALKAKAVSNHLRRSPCPDEHAEESDDGEWYAGFVRQAASVGVLQVFCPKLHCEPGGPGSAEQLRSQLCKDGDHFREFNWAIVHFLKDVLCLIVLVTLPSSMGPNFSPAEV